jgi:hypothetical protein
LTASKSIFTGANIRPPGGNLLTVARCVERFPDIRDDDGTKLLCQFEQCFCILYSTVNFHDALEAVPLWPADNDSVFKHRVFPRVRRTPRQKAIIALQGQLNSDSHGPKLLWKSWIFKRDLEGERDGQ